MESIYLAAIVDSSDDAIIARDLDGFVIKWNPAAERIFGYRADEIVGRPITCLFPPGRRQEEDRIIERIMRGERVERVETLRRTKDGRDIPISLTISPILSVDGTIMGFSKIARDITEVRRTNVELRQWANAFEKAAFGIAIVDGKSNAVQFANPTLARMLGMEPGELRGMKAVEIYAPEERPSLAGLAVIIDRTGHLAFDSRHIRKDGSIYPVHMDITSVRDGDGSVLYRIASASDITERKRDENKLLEAQRRSDEMVALLDTLQSTAPIGVAFIDRSFRYVRVNEVLAATIGYAAQDLIGREVRATIPDLWPRVASTFRDVIETGKSFVNIELRRGKSAAAEERHWLASYYPVQIRDEIIGIGAVLVEITNQKRLEQRLIQAQKMEAIGNLTGGMAHDFNNLLSVILGNLGLLRESGGIGIAFEPLLADAFDAAERGADLIGRLLAFARRQPLQPRRVDLNDMIANLIKLLRRTLGEAIEISLELAPGIWPIIVDPAQLEASLTNLATNARDAMPGGGQLIIATMNQTLDRDYAAQHPDVAPGDYAVIKISDTGTGMTAEVMSRIFEPFFTTKIEGKGTGLGLSMVFGFIKQSGGHVSVYSEIGHGTTFNLYLPRAAQGAAQGTEAQDERQMRGGNETVLVVEDNAAMRRVVSRQLTELGYRVIEAENGVAALAILESQSIDLLFTDLIMPGEISGVDLADRAGARWPKLKIVLTSGFPEPRLNHAAAPSLPAMRLLGKPYRKDELARVMREVLDR